MKKKIEDEEMKGKNDKKSIFKVQIISGKRENDLRERKNIIRDNF